MFSQLFRGFIGQFLKRVLTVVLVTTPVSDTYAFSPPRNRPSRNRVKIIFLTTVGAGTWVVPADWNNADNSIEVIAGGSGGVKGGSSNGGRGGGGGAYAKSINVTLTPGASMSYFVGAGGGASGQASWFDSTSTLWAEGGTNGAGGRASVSIANSTKASGASGGTTSSDGGGGGGGAGGPGGNGKAGGNSSDKGGGGGGGAGGGSSTNGTAGAAGGGAGGQGPLGTGSGAIGTAGTKGGGGGGGNDRAYGGAGGIGRDISANDLGYGGGGGGGAGGRERPGSNGGLYGGGGGGGGKDDIGSASLGAQGIIVIKYRQTP